MIVHGLLVLERCVRFKNFGLSSILLGFSLVDAASAAATVAWTTWILLLDASLRQHIFIFHLLQNLSFAGLKIRLGLLLVTGAFAGEWRVSLGLQVLHQIHFLHGVNDVIGEDSGAVRFSADLVGLVRYLVDELHRDV